MKSLYKFFTVAIVFVFIAGTHTGCKKKWKKPTETTITFELDMKKSHSGNLQFESGYVVLESFRFKGDRKQAEDTEFEKEYENGLKVTLPSGSEIPELKFDIPQGTYDPIEFEFDTFDDENTASIYIRGTYYTDNGQSRPVIFDFRSSETFEVSSETDDGSSEINLVHGEPEISVITLNPSGWFQSVSSSMLDEAELRDVDGIPTIYISEEYNEDIFDLVEDDLDRSLESTFTR